MLRALAHHFGNSPYWLWKRNSGLTILRARSSCHWHAPTIALGWLVAEVNRNRRLAQMSSRWERNTFHEGDSPMTKVVNRFKPIVALVRTRWSSRHRSKDFLTEVAAW